MALSRSRLPLALVAAALSAAVPALAEDAPWLVQPEPMGGRALGLVEAADKAAAADEAARVVGGIRALPPGQAVSALEAVLRGRSAPAAAKEAVLKALADEEAGCPVSRALANAVLKVAPKDGWPRAELWLRSLRRFDSPEVERKLAEWARDPALSFEQRSTAIRALGGLPSLGRLEVLLSLHAGGQAADWVRDDVNRALMEMFCLSAPPTEAQLQDWRRLVASHDPAVLKRKLKDQFEQRVRLAEGERARLVERIVKQAEDLYVRTPTDDQPALLAKMLADPDLPEVRLKALDLVDARLQVNQPVEGALREAVRACADHPTPLVRSRSISLLRNLGDGPGAQAVAKRLADGAEDNAEVLAAMARMMRGQPRKEALPAVRRLLDHPSDAVAVAAASALAAYAEAGLVDAPLKAELARAAKGVLRPVRADFAAAESHLQLLGRVLGPEDADGWSLVAGWLASAAAPPPARLAAARAIERSDQPLAPLLAAGLAEGADAALAEVALRAVGARGAARADADPLAARMPAPGALRDAWADALAGWASRAAPADVEAVARAALRAGAPKPVAVRMLGKALGGKDLPPPRRALLLSFRAELLEEGGDLAAAIEDADNAFPALEGAPRAGAFARRVRLRLVQGKVAEAAAVCAKQAAAGSDAPALLKDPLPRTLAALEKEGEAAADKRAAFLPILKELRQALAAHSGADLLPPVDALLAKWAPPEPEPKPPVPPQPQPAPPEPKPGEKPAEKPAEKPGEKPGDKRPAQKPAAAKNP